MKVEEIKLSLENNRVQFALVDDLKNNVKSSETIYFKLEKAIQEMDSLEQSVISKRKDLKTMQSLALKEYNSLLNIWDKINLNSKELGVDAYKSVIGFADAKKLINVLKSNADVVDEYMKPI